MKKSTVLFILSLVGGIIVLLVGVDRLIDVALFGSYGGTDTGLDAALDVGFGMACGLLIIGGSIMLFRKPQRHRIWGALVLVFSLLSFVGTAGGVFIGLLFGLIGSIYAIVSKPPVPPS